MLIYNIHDYDDFQYLFGMEYHGNGVKSRKNKILLQHLKNPSLIKWCRDNDDRSLINVRNMADLKKQVIKAIEISGQDDISLPYEIHVMGKTFHSSLYKTDEEEGVCEDFDKKSIRYINVERDRAFKMKAGKFFNAIIKETEIGKILSEQVVVWLCEELSADWATYTMGKTPQVELHVDDNFQLIYDEEACRDFNGCSCMVGRDRHHFYEDSVTAKAAYLLDIDGYVLARAIIFTDVTDQDGKTWRLCERQYSKESSDVLKRLLVDQLIKGGYIDGYKQIGAGCSESRAFVDNDGNSLADMRFSIECDLGYTQCLSYQDSFKYYDIDNNVAYNYSDVPYNYCLDTTDYNLDGEDDEDEDEQEYDDYHDYNCAETRLCYLHGSEVYVDVDNLEDFIYVEGDGEYHHKDDVTTCEYCGKLIVKEEATFLDDHDFYFCDSECEDRYKESNWYYAEWDEEYYPKESDITVISVWSEEYQAYKEITISKETKQSLINRGKAFGHGETWFIPSCCQAA